MTVLDDITAAIRPIASAADAKAAADAELIASLRARIAELEAAPIPEPEPPVVDPPVTPIPSTGIYGPTGKIKFAYADPSAAHEVEPTWAAIRTQITACQSHPGVCKIAVKPGTLPSGTSASSSTAGVLASVGSTSKRIIVTPRDGYGTVKIATASTGTAIVSVKGVIFDYIDFSGTSGLMIRNCENVGVGHTRLKTLLGTANGGNGLKKVEFVEIVLGPEMVTGVSYDRSQFKTASSAAIDGITFRGCYVAPNWKPNGSSGHCDSIQFERLSGGGNITNVSFEDSVIFRSADQCIQTNALSGGTFKNTAFFGNDVCSLRYPLYPGGDPATLDNTLNGTWQNISADGVLLAGSISSSYTFSSVKNSKSTQGARGFEKLGTISKAELDRIAPVPSTGLWA